MTADRIPTPPVEPSADVLAFPRPSHPVQPERFLRSVAARIGPAGGAPHAGLTLTMPGGLPETLSATDDVAVRVDWLQHEIQQGPRVGHTEGWTTLFSPELNDDPRWPQFGPLCAAVIGMHSMVSVRLPLPDDIHATINFYAEEPGVFTQADADTALRLSGRAATALVLHLRDRNDRATSGHSRMATALGIIMARYRVTSADAFSMLRNASHDLGCDVLELAAEVTADGRLPARAISLARRERGRAGAR